MIAIVNYIYGVIMGIVAVILLLLPVIIAYSTTCIYVLLWYPVSLLVIFGLCAYGIFGRKDVL